MPPCRSPELSLAEIWRGVQNLFDTARQKLVGLENNVVDSSREGEGGSQLSLKIGSPFQGYAIISPPQPRVTNNCWGASIVHERQSQVPCSAKHYFLLRSIYRHHDRKYEASFRPILFRVTLSVHRVQNTGHREAVGQRHPQTRATGWCEIILMSFACDPKTERCVLSAAHEPKNV